jgi:hypothetical protein
MIVLRGVEIELGRHERYRVAGRIGIIAYG